MRNVCNLYGIHTKAKSFMCVVKSLGLHVRVLPNGLCPDHYSPRATPHPLLTGLETLDGHSTGSLRCFSQRAYKYACTFSFLLIFSFSFSSWLLVGDIVSGIVMSHCYKRFSVVFPMMVLQKTEGKIFGDLNLEV